jgi:hypothetical protein
MKARSKDEQTLQRLTSHEGNSPTHTADAVYPILFLEDATMLMNFQQREVTAR